MLILARSLRVLDVLSITMSGGGDLHSTRGRRSVRVNLFFVDHFDFLRITVHVLGLAVVILAADI